MEKDPFDQLFKDMSKSDIDEIVKYYRGYGEHFTKISISTNNTLINWGYGLNFSALGLCIAFMVTNPDANNLTKEIKLFFSVVTLIFFFNIFLMFLSAKLEKYRFEKKGRILDDNFERVMSNHITASQFMNDMRKYTPNLDFFVPWLEYTSNILFFIGALSALLIIICK